MRAILRRAVLCGDSLCEDTKQPNTEANGVCKHDGRRTTESGGRRVLRATRHVFSPLSVCLFIHRLCIPALQPRGRSHQQQAAQRHCFKPTSHPPCIQSGGIYVGWRPRRLSLFSRSVLHSHAPKLVLVVRLCHTSSRVEARLRLEHFWERLQRPNGSKCEGG